MRVALRGDVSPPHRVDQGVDRDGGALGREQRAPGPPAPSGRRAASVVAVPPRRSTDRTPSSAARRRGGRGASSPHTQRARGERPGQALQIARLRRDRSGATRVNRPRRGRARCTGSRPVARRRRGAGLRRRPARGGRRRRPRRRRCSDPPALRACRPRPGCGGSRLRCSRAALARASLAPPKTAITPSPVCLTTVPPWAAMAS